MFCRTEQKKKNELFIDLKVMRKLREEGNFVKTSTKYQHLHQTLVILFASAIFIEKIQDK